jgi:hypothetical protein
MKLSKAKSVIIPTLAKNWNLAIVAFPAEGKS